MGWNARAAHLVRRLSVALCAALIVCVVGAVYAAGARVTPTSTGYYRMGTNAVGGTRFGTRTEFSALWENALGGSVSRTVTAVGEVSSTTLGSLGRKALRGGVYGAAVGLAVEGIIKGAGWAINELKDEVQTPSSPATEAPPGTLMVCKSGASGDHCTTAANPAGLCGYIQSLPGGYTMCTVVSADPESGFVRYQVTEGGGTEMAIYQRFNVAMPIYGTGQEPRTITDQEIGDVLKDQPRIVNDLLIDPRTGAPIMTPELQQQADKIKQDIDQREGIGDGSPNPVVTPPLDDDTPQSTETSWPSFCGWATVVCNFIDWFKSDDSPSKEALPERELEIDPNSWSSGVGEGACPAPQQFAFTVAGHAANGEFSFQPLCDFSTVLKPFLIAVASIVAVMILAGLRSTTTK